MKILIDLDDTLVNTTSLNNDAYNYALEKFGFKRINKNERITRDILNINNTFENNTILIFEWSMDGKKYWNHYLIGEKPIDFKTYCENMKKYGFDK